MSDLKTLEDGETVEVTVKIAFEFSADGIEGSGEYVDLGDLRQRIAEELGDVLQTIWISGHDDADDDMELKPTSVEVFSLPLKLSD